MQSPTIRRARRRAGRRRAIPHPRGRQPARASSPAMVVSQSDIASEVGWKVMRERRQRHRRRRRHGLRAGGHPSHRRQHRRRRLHRLPGGGWHRHDLRLPRDGPGRLEPDDVDEGRQVRLRRPPQHATGRSACPARSPACTWPGRSSAASRGRTWCDPAVALARDGFDVSDGLARSLARMLVEPDDFKKYPASLAQFSKNGQPYEAGDILKQPDLARTLQRIADQGPAGFYEGETAELIEKEMKANGGLITRDDLKNYQAKERAPIKGTYRGYEVIGMPPPSSGGIAVVADAERARGLRPQGQRLRLGAEPAPGRRVDAPGVRRPRPAPRRSRLRRQHPGRAAHLEGLRRAGAQDHQPEQGVGVVAVDLHRGRPSRRRRRTCRSSTRSATPCR